MLTLIIVLWVVLGSSDAPVGSLSVRSTPEGASVQLDGLALPGVTPLAHVPVEPGHDYRLRVSAPGYEPTEVSFSAREGLQAQRVSLQRTRVRLRVEASVSGLGVSVNGSPRASPPLEIPGLLPGSSVRIIVTGPDDAPARELSHVVSSDDPNVVNVDPEPVPVTQPAPSKRRRPRTYRRRWRR
ncbi:MAG: PEGA domain-containing protein [Deltaproteobacteria bacterium]|nr:PEGA domain-containing protein [Deltaproteobacteria bacterium]